MRNERDETGTNGDLSSVMNHVERLPCEACGDDFLPSAYAACLDTTPSGADLFGVFQCPSCEAQYAISFELDGFMHWFNTELALRLQMEVEDDEKDHQRWRSAMGRKVAAFRRELEAVATVEDMWQT